MTLTFDAKNHSYALDGKRIKGVTGLIAGGTPKDQLIWWAATEAGRWAAENKHALASMTDESIISDAQRQHLRTRDRAGITGTGVHDLAEALHDGGEVQTSNPLHASFLEGYADFLDAWEITPILFEHVGANREHWYAGKFDLIASSPHLAGGDPVMIDLKTSKSIYGEVAMQEAAYSMFDFHLDGFDTETPMPDIVATYVAHVTPTHREGDAARYAGKPLGTSLYPLAQTPKQIDTHFGWFLNAMATAKNASKRDRLIKEPLTIPETTAAQAA